jgi:hypothetical protein
VGVGRDSLLGTGTQYGLECSRIKSLRGQYCDIVRTRSDHTGSTIGTASLSWNKIGRGVALTIHLSLAQKLKK